MRSILVSAAWRKDNLNAPNQRIIDCSWEDRNFKHTFQVQPARAVGSLPDSFLEANAASGAMVPAHAPSRNSRKAPSDRLWVTQARAGLLMVYNVGPNEPDAWLLRMLSPRCSCLPRSASNTPGYSPGFVRLFNEILPIVSCILPNAAPSLPEGVYWQKQLYST